MPSNPNRVVVTPPRMIPFMLPGGGEIQVTGTFPVPAEDWEHFVAVLEAMRPGLVTGNGHGKWTA